MHQFPISSSRTVISKSLDVEQLEFFFTNINCSTTSTNLLIMILMSFFQVFKKLPVPRFARKGFSSSTDRQHFIKLDHLLVRTPSHVDFGWSFFVTLNVLQSTLEINGPYPHGFHRCDRDATSRKGLVIFSLDFRIRKPISSPDFRRRGLEKDKIFNSVANYYTLTYLLRRKLAHKWHFEVFFQWKQ